MGWYQDTPLVQGEEWVAGMLDLGDVSNGKAMVAVECAALPGGVGGIGEGDVGELGKWWRVEAASQRVGDW
jgi:hypothetical protein